MNARPDSAAAEGEFKLDAYLPYRLSVAANAVITDPLRINIRMDCPAKGNGEYVTKLATLTALQATLSAHNAAGGLYTIATPSFIYTNTILRRPYHLVTG